jgi:hypothetical protein
MANEFKVKNGLKFPDNSVQTTAFTGSSGTVTSVGLSLPAVFTVTGSPVTTSGTLTAALASQTANQVWAAPNGTTGAPTFRALVAADIPALDLAVHLPDSAYKKIVRVATTADVGPSTFSANVLTGYSNTQSLACTTTAASTSVTTTSTAGLKVGAVVSTATVQVAAGTSVASITSATVFVVNNRANITTTAITGTGATATATFAAQTYAPYAVGSSIVVSGATPATYNGTKTVTACTTTSVSFASTETVTATVQGTIAFTIAAGTSITTAFAQTIAALAIDGITLAANDRVLVKDQNTLGGLVTADAPKYNGIYYVSATGSASVPWTLTRALDADASADLDGAIVNVSVGTANYGKSYKTRFKGTDTLNTTQMFWGRVVDVNSSSRAALPVTAIGTDIATDTETVVYNTGNVADYSVMSLGVKTLQAVGASTYTRAATLYIAGAPVASTNATITTPYSLYIAGGNSYLGAACTATSFNGITGLASVAPVASGTAAVGTSTLAARQDHVHPISTLTLGTGLSGTSYNGSAAITAAVSYGTTATTACVGNDARLSDARAPTAHTHSVTIGSTAMTTGSTYTSVAGLTLTGSAFNGTVGATTPSSVVATSTSTGTLLVTGAGANEGGEIGLAPPTSGSNWSGNIAIDVNANSVRVFGVNNTTTKIFSIDFGAMAASAAVTALHTGNGLALSGGTLTGQLISTDTYDAATGGGSIYLNSATGNRIDFNTNGAAAPAFTTRSAGTKIVLYPGLGAASVDYALGIESFTLWASVPDSGRAFKWYHGTNNTLTLNYNRIQADWSNANPEGRLAFQTSTANGGTGVYAVPNGTATNCNFSAWNNSTTTNASGIVCGVSATEAYINSTILGTGTYLPLVMRTSGVARLTIDAAGISTFTNEIRSNSNITAYYPSDKRLKENIALILSPIDKVNSIGGYEFDWIDSEIEKRGGEDGYFVRKHDLGVIAQEVQKVLPDAVAEREDGLLAVRYEKIIPLLIESIKELNCKIEMMRNTNNA